MNRSTLVLIATHVNDRCRQRDGSPQEPVYQRSADGYPLGMSSRREDVRAVTEVDLIVDEFAGAGLDGHVLAHLQMADRRSQSVTFVISDVDRESSSGLGAEDVSGVWRVALAEMADRLGEELMFSGPRGMAHPITVRSRMARTHRLSTPPSLEYTHAGGLMAHFSI